MPRVDNLDLNLFEFDYDLTFMVFFMDAEQNVYARYGGRDSKDADNRQSLEGLAYTMKSVLEMHGRQQKEYAPKTQDKARYLRDLTGGPGGLGGGGRCLHCHQVREAINGGLRRAGKWDRDLAWRYPLPENVGVTLEVHKGNVVKSVAEKSPAAAAGIKPGDILQKLNGVPVHSFGDAQYALDRAPAKGAVEVVWRRGEKTLEEKLTLEQGWRKTDISWRPSMKRMIASSRLYGEDLKPEEKKALGLEEKQLAFRQKDAVPTQARNAGIKGGDIILGVDGKTLQMDVTEFSYYVQSNYLVGDKVTVNLLRDGKRMELTMTFIP